MQWIENYLLQPFGITWCFIIFEFATDTSLHICYEQAGTRRETVLY